MESSAGHGAGQDSDNSRALAPVAVRRVRADDARTVGFGGGGGGGSGGGGGGGGGGGESGAVAGSVLQGPLEPPVKQPLDFIGTQVSRLSRCVELEDAPFQTCWLGLVWFGFPLLSSAVRVFFGQAQAVAPALNMHLYEMVYPSYQLSIYCIRHLH